VRLHLQPEDERETNRILLAQHIHCGEQLSAQLEGVCRERGIKSALLKAPVATFR